MKRLNSAILAAAGAAFLLSAGVAYAGAAANLAAATAAADQRGDLLEDLGHEMDVLAPMVRNPDAFNAGTAKATADKMAALAGRIPAAFQTDTRGFRVKTSAKDNIWQTMPDFLAKSRALNEAIANLQKATASGQRPAVVPAIAQVGQACRNCHTSYKAD